MTLDEETTEGTGGSDIDVDALVDNIEKTGSADGAQEPAPQEAAPQAPVEPEFEFEARGQKIKAKYSDPKLKQWAQQGYDYAQRMAEFNKNQSRYQEIEKAHKAYEERYKPIDDYAKKDPEWWKHVETSWQNRESWKQQSANDPVTQAVTALQSRIDQLEGKVVPTIDEYGKIIQTQKEQRLNEELDNEIKGIQQEYPDIDMSAQDESGKSLEHRVLEFATENGIRNFKQAFKLFNHDALVQKAKETALSETAKATKKNRESGLLGKTPAPASKGLSDANSVRSKSYEDLTQEALRELGIH